MDTADTAVDTTDSAERVADNTDRIPVPDTGLCCHRSINRIAANTAGTGFRPSSNKDRRLVRLRRG